MAKIRISVPSEGFEATATLAESEAPKTCRGILGILPVEGSLLHAMSSGNETLIELQDNKKIRLEPENWVFNFVPGDILYWFSLWGDGKYLRGVRDNAEIVFIYGRNAKLRDVALRDSPANLFATIDQKVTEFAEVCRGLRTQGPKKIVIGRV
jgi:hypothetical protein